MIIQSTLLKYIDWERIVASEHIGESGTSFWKTFDTDNIRVRIVEYNKGFKSDHYCIKGHIIYVLDGSLILAMKNGITKSIIRDMCIIIGDGEQNSHLAYTKEGAKVLIID
jgi:hypothetical protein